MAKPDRRKFARENAALLILIFALIAVFGLMRANVFALIGGLVGIGWVAWARLSKD